VKNADPFIDLVYTLYPVTSINGRGKWLGEKNPTVEM